ncbi:hypothetical protein AVEN_152020-1 [Araneus ventricosus]|uniref:Uncharacterized protein n=1 Tax=Araneus ventricosus TaxID=182803 RepID=A0A4Y2X8H9_ARAVE|nr:hypothetical protein AVEN_152020-1 [Araneus ventricosus]
MTGAKVIAVFVMLPWMWGLFQIFVYGNLSYIFYMIPYLLGIQIREKKTANKGTNVDIDDSAILKRKDACISTGDINSVKRSNDDMIELNYDYCQNIVSENNPFLHMLGNPGAHGDELATNPFIIEDASQLHPSGNPFLDINDTAVVLDTEERNLPLLSTNPFLQDFSNNKITDISIFFPNGLGDIFADIPFAPTESDVYCKEWIEQHRKCFIKTVRSFSIH